MYARLLTESFCYKPPHSFSLTAWRFPLFDGETVKAQVAKGEHTCKRPLFCSVMAACAVASARVRDGSLITPESQRPYLLGIPPEDYFAAAEDALPPNLLEVHDFHYLRGCALMALASIQDGRIDCMRKYLGHYFTIMAIRRWHDEMNWPAALTPVEKEERRRLVREVPPTQRHPSS